jgi:hypothetical protein
LGIAPELDRFYTEAHITWVEPVWEAIGDRSDPVSPNARNADHKNIKPKARCHAVDLVAHWACITIDIDVGQLSARLLSGAGFGA